MRTRHIPRGLGRCFALLSFAGWVSVAYGCQSEGSGEQRMTEPLGESETSCGPDVTYKAVAKPFLDEYCRDCHSKAAADAGAKVPHVFSNEAVVKELGAHIYEVIENRTMPPLEDDPELPKPSSKDRRAMLEWLECSGAAAEPEEEHDHE